MKNIKKTTPAGQWTGLRVSVGFSILAILPVLIGCQKLPPDPQAYPIVFKPYYNAWSAISDIQIVPLDSTQSNLRLLNTDRAEGRLRFDLVDQFKVLHELTAHEPPVMKAADTITCNYRDAPAFDSDSTGIVTFYQKDTPSKSELMQVFLQGKIDSAGKEHFSESRLVLNRPDSISREKWTTSISGPFLLDAKNGSTRAAIVISHSKLRIPDQVILMESVFPWKVAATINLANVPNAMELLDLNGDGEEELILAAAGCGTNRKYGGQNSSVAYCYAVNFSGKSLWTFAADTAGGRSSVFIQREPKPRLFYIQTCRNFIDSLAYTNLYELEPATGKLLRHKKFTGFGEFSHSDRLDSSHFVLVADNVSRQIYWLNMDFLPEGKPRSIPSPDYIATSRAINAGIDFPPLYALLLQGGGEMLVDDNLKPQVYSEYHLDPYLSNQPISPRSRQSYVVRDGAGLTVIRARDKDGRPHLVYAASNPLWWFHRYRWEITIFVGLMAIGGIDYFGYKFWRRRRQHQRDVGIWQQFMSPQLIELFKHKDPRKDPIHLRVRVTIMNSDLRNFTNYSQNAGSPEIVFDTLSPYYEAVSVEVANNGGIMDKFMGDGAMALFGVPLKDDERRNYCLRATNVCSDILKQFDEVKKKWLENGYPAKDVGLGFGIATGSVSFGTVGSSRRFDLTVIGSAANLSSKLCAMAKHGEVKMDSETYEAVREKIGECEETVHNDIKGFEDAGVNVFTWRPER